MYLSQKEGIHSVRLKFKRCFIHIPDFEYHTLFFISLTNALPLYLLLIVLLLLGPWCCRTTCSVAPCPASAVIMPRCRNSVACLPISWSRNARYVVHLVIIVASGQWAWGGGGNEGNLRGNMGWEKILFLSECLEKKNTSLGLLTKFII